MKTRGSAPPPPSCSLRQDVLDPPLIVEFHRGWPESVAGFPPSPPLRRRLEVRFQGEFSDFEFKFVHLVVHINSRAPVLMPFEISNPQQQSHQTIQNCMRVFLFRLQWYYSTSLDMLAKKQRKLTSLSLESQA